MEQSSLVACCRFLPVCGEWKREKSCAISWGSYQVSSFESKIEKKLMKLLKWIAKIFKFGLKFFKFANFLGSNAANPPSELYECNFYCFISSPPGKTRKRKDIKKDSHRKREWKLKCWNKKKRRRKTQLTSQIVSRVFCVSSR